MKIDPSTVFSTFDMDQLAKIHQHRWKECLKINKAAKFESDMLKTNEELHPQSREILQTGKFVSPTIQTSVKFRDFAKLYLARF